MNQARFQKQQREKARRERAAAKWARREERRGLSAPESSAAAEQEYAELLGQLADLHQRYDRGDIELGPFLENKDEILQRLEGR